MTLTFTLHAKYFAYVDSTSEKEVDGFQCVCNNGYSGQFCEIPPDHCADNPCQNGGLCGQGDESAVCSCPSGFSGLFCEIDMNECQSSPCMNGAICEDGEDSYQCNCAAGFAGHDCDVNINDCLHEQCQNGASCVDLIDGFMCQCPPSYTGQYCERELSSDFNLVFRRRVTTDYATLDRYTLPDMEAFTIGFWLRTDSDSGTVLSYATTVDGTTQDNAIVVGFFGDFKFQLNGETMYVDLTIDDGTWHYVVVTWTNQDGELKFYFDGVLASQRQHLQEGAVIPGGGVLILGQEQDELGGGFSPPESLVADLSRLNIWSFVLSELDIMQLSSHCEDKIGDLAAWPDFVLNRMAEVELVSPSNFCSDVDQCLPNPCENGGTCHDSVSDFVCECPSGYAGDTCTQRALHCNPDVCNNGRCRDQGDSYVCDCHIGFTGDHCEVEINECQSQPCQNGGTCTDSIGHFVCQCPTGYNGSQCENEIICDTPPTAQHSDARIQPGDFVVGTRVRYFCQQGYAPSTPTMTLTCDNNGQWSGDHPSCHDIDECASGEHECQHVCRNSLGSYVCECHPGFVLDDDGKHCKEINCGPIGTLENGDVTATGSKMGDAITFTCNQGFRLVDTEFQECEENGKWSGTRPYCQPII
ncbi:sushi, von Willebrand factor type A, EGF and pentraxin domain-containing protein 1-like [Ptychodera flava]|uniref:sushi, von Willebrand factor type A, EGF and pentraxin domain-containing protein 1-like n=1 Tax=Ptychodera flava TaxID=63121 RepID=UPI00396AA6AB